jgi:Cysteine-rich CPXCG
VATTACPHCGEVIDTFPDPGGGETQEYIEDCAVCCRPILFVAALDDRTGDFNVTASPEV